MALGDAYALADELKHRAGGIADPAEEPAIENALLVASIGINGVTERQFNKATVASARHFRPKSSCMAVVHDFYTTSGLVIKTDDSGTGTYGTTWAASDFELEPLDGIVGQEPGWPYWIIRAVGGRTFPVGNRRASLQVTAAWGWNAIPAGVKEACLLVGIEIYALKETKFGVGGVAEWGTIRVRENPMAMKMISKYMLDPVKMA